MTSELEQKNGGHFCTTMLNYSYRHVIGIWKAYGKTKSCFEYYYNHYNIQGFYAPCYFALSYLQTISLGLNMVAFLLQISKGIICLVYDYHLTMVAKIKRPSSVCLSVCLNLLTFSTCSPEPPDHHYQTWHKAFFGKRILTICQMKGHSLR